MFRLPGMLEGLLQRHGTTLPGGAEDEIPLIKRDLEEIITILKGLGGAGRSKMAVSCWTKEVRELSYDMEDFIDEYEHVRSRSSMPRRNRKVTWRPRRSNTTLPYWLHEQLRQRLWTANKIREFSVRAQEALRRHVIYQLGSITASTSGARRADASSSSRLPATRLHDDVLVGIDASMDKLEEWLMTMHDYEEHQKLGLNNLKSLTLLPTASFYANSLDQSSATVMTVSSDDISNAFSTLTLIQRLEFSPHICIFSCLPKCIGQLTKLCILKIGVGKMVSNCVDVLKGLPALSVLSLYVHYKPAETIVIGKAGFPVLKYFMFKCRDPMLKFEADAMPNLRKLMLGFSAQRADQVAIPFGIEHLSGLKEVYAKVVAAGYEEPDRRATELAFRNAMRMHAGCCRVIVTCVNKSFRSKEDQSSVPREERATLKQRKMKEVSNEHVQIMENTVKEAVQNPDSRFMLSEWNMLLLLRNKLDTQNDDITSGIPVVNPYSLDPWKLGAICMETGEPQFYFRPLQEAKDGPAPSGYWRETGSTEYIYSAKRLPIGMKRTMEFYHGSAPSGEKITWKMVQSTHA
ncbi:hypothetical protein PR202_ga16348 [Eleusine coracana subsp. coracana]|uniref:NAC domain-containing protein n=1 Tax=Eleusine coracana subsp. coracana TaxID=191504 RepID=A0AAV5CMY0_ELECO|nr:hypothetical protein PR202_ga16348 [Eleusine coracana subsp. coracana]